VSSVGTGRAYLLAMKAYKEALARSPRDQAECDRLYAAANSAYEIHQDYLQAERDEARADAEER